MCVSVSLSVCVYEGVYIAQMQVCVSVVLGTFSVCFYGCTGGEVLKGVICCHLLEEGKCR